VRLVNPAVNGFTTEDLIRSELPLLQREQPRLVSLLIGANDIVQGFHAERYAANLRTIHDAIQNAAPVSVLCVSIPDWSAAPAARAFGEPVKLRGTIERFNDVARSEAEARGALWADVTAFRGAPVAADGLHPDDMQYAAWAVEILRVVGEPWRAALS
jgi:lysophospholipase L1-like esterase